MPYNGLEQIRADGSLIPPPRHQRTKIQNFQSPVPLPNPHPTLRFLPAVTQAVHTPKATEATSSPINPGQLEPQKYPRPLPY